MPISSTLAARLRTGHSPAPAPAPAPARRSPYARPSVPEPRGGAKASRPPLRLDPATARLLGPSQKAVRSGLGRRAEPDAPDARAPESKPKLAAGDDRPPLEEKHHCSGEGGRRPEPDARAPESKPNLAAGDDRTPLEEKRRCSGEGGFVFLSALAGHTEAISGISLPLGSDKLYTGSVDGSVRIWDCNSGKCVDVIKMGGKVGCMITHGPWVFIGIPKSVEAWNTKTGMKLSLQGPSSLVCSMGITDEMLFAGTGDGHIMAWRFPAKESNIEPVSILSGHQRQVISLSISARRLYSGSQDKTIKAWDLTTWQCVQTLSEHKAAVTSVLCWDEKLLSCSLDKTVKVWTLSESGNLQVKYTHTEEHGLRTLFGMHRVGKTPVLFCSLHNSNCIRLLDLPSFAGIGALFSIKEVRTIELTAGGLLFTGGCSSELKVWRWAPQDQEAVAGVHSCSSEYCLIEE